MKVSLVSIPVQNPIKAHEIYTSQLGFVSKELDPDANLAIVVSRDDPDGTAILLEPCQGNFAESYQKSAFEANLPIMVLEVKNVKSEFKRMEVAGVKLRPELDKPKWGIQNVFEDGCGNLLMIEETPT
ncbi:VOC family protein [uncultured Microbulbifer sp.]|uniref:VOC family protein n=1 Tax=uncultured Microbulbifer sp. TaxID=348147 RepID=UPI00260F34A3|nr:VOC family protein [uncultured Microbulbifer sp.]